MKFLPRLCILFAMLSLAARCGAQSVQTDRSTYEVGERVVVTFSGCPSSGTDWVGIYPASQQQHQGSTYWRYCQGGQAPAGTGPAAGSLTFLPMSLPAGQWQARLFFSDSYTLRATANFTIASAAASPTPPPQGDLTLMCFNIWVSGSNVANGPALAADAIREARADIIGLQECNAAALATILQALRVDPAYANAAAIGNGGQGVISRFGIDQTYTSANARGVGAKVRLPSGDAIRFFSCHLTAYPYGPYSVRDGRSLQDILNDENTTRVQDLTGVMTLLSEPATNEPWLTTFIVGDFNCPSHLDWTDANRSQNFNQVVTWPVTRMLADAGYSDTWRLAHPDPTTHRGLTWSPGYPAGPPATLEHDDVHDRIDMIHLRARADLDVKVVQAYTLDRTPWPSDHRAVVTSVAFAAPCIADFNRDGELNSQDFFDFVAAFFAGCP